jgi:hypothetical protein
VKFASLPKLITNFIPLTQIGSVQFVPFARVIAAIRLVPPNVNLPKELS